MTGIVGYYTASSSVLGSYFPLPEEAQSCVVQNDRGEVIDQKSCETAQVEINLLDSGNYRRRSDGRVISKYIQGGRVFGSGQSVFVCALVSGRTDDLVAGHRLIWLKQQRVL